MHEPLQWEERDLRPGERDLTGQRYGRLTVLYPALALNRANPSKEGWWACACDCGAVSPRRRRSLVYGHISACLPCAQRQRALVLVPCRGCGVDVPMRATPPRGWTFCDGCAGKRDAHDRARTSRTRYAYAHAVRGRVCRWCGTTDAMVRCFGRKLDVCGACSRALVRHGGHACCGRPVRKWLGRPQVDAPHSCAQGDVCVDCGDPLGPHPLRVARYRCPGCAPAKQPKKARAR